MHKSAKEGVFVQLFPHVKQTKVEYQLRTQTHLLSVVINLKQNPTKKIFLKRPYKVRIYLKTPVALLPCRHEKRSLCATQ